MGKSNHPKITATWHDIAAKLGIPKAEQQPAQLEEAAGIKQAGQEDETTDEESQPLAASPVHKQPECSHWRQVVHMDLLQ